MSEITETAGATVGSEALHPATRLFADEIDSKKRGSDQALVAKTSRPRKAIRTDEAGAEAAPINEDEEAVHNGKAKTQATEEGDAPGDTPDDVVNVIVRQANSGGGDGRPVIKKGVICKATKEDGGGTNVDTGIKESIDGDIDGSDPAGFGHRTIVVEQGMPKAVGGLQPGIDKDKKGTALATGGTIIGIVGISEHEDTTTDRNGSEGRDQSPSLGPESNSDMDAKLQVTEEKDAPCSTNVIAEQANIVGVGERPMNKKDVIDGLKEDGGGANEGTVNKRDEGEGTDGKAVKDAEDRTVRVEKGGPAVIPEMVRGNDQANKVIAVATAGAPGEIVGITDKEETGLGPHGRGGRNGAPASFLVTIKDIGPITRIEYSSLTHPERRLSAYNRAAIHTRGGLSALLLAARTQQTDREEEENA